MARESYESGRVFFSLCLPRVRFADAHDCGAKHTIRKDDVDDLVSGREFRLCTTCGVHRGFRLGHS